MRNIGLDLGVLNNQYKTGVESYCINLFKEICKISSERYFLIGSAGENIFDKNISRIQIDLSQSNTDFANKVMLLMGYINDLDLVHSPYLPISERRTYKGILTIHDLIPLRKPEWFANDEVHEFFDVRIRNSVKHIDHIIADSQSTKNDIVDLFKVEESKVSVIYLGVDTVFNEMLTNSRENDKSILKKYNINLDYVISVCTVEPRKNIKGTLRAYEIFRDRYKEKINLVLVGKLGWKYDDLLRLIKESKFSNDIILTGYIPDQDLPILYRNAEAFMYPSLYEGFGLPVLEAMTCSVPVITSEVSSLPEVGGDSVMYCNPYSVESIAYALEEVLTKPSLSKLLSEKGKVRAEQFSWQKSAEQTHQLYLNCLK